MGEKFDDLTGRAKEAAGDLTGDEDLQREGKIDQGKAEVKEKVGDITDRVSDAVKDITK